jgi:hypothetical protein
LCLFLVVKRVHETKENSYTLWGIYIPGIIDT